MINESRKNELNKYREKFSDFPIIRPKTQELLEKIVDARKPALILELGTGKGYSGSVMLSTYDGANLLTIEKDAENYKEAMKTFVELEFFDRILPVNADAEEVVHKLSESVERTGQKFDLIFLDCSKSAYLRMADDLINLLSDGGVLVADNCLYFGKVLGEPEIPAKKHRTIVVNLRKFIDKIKNDERLTNTVIYDIEDGVLVTNLKSGAELKEIEKDLKESEVENITTNDNKNDDTKKSE